jgi:hypothetical protein
MTIYVNDSFTASDGSAWSASWTAAASDTGASATIQSNQGDQNAGSTASGGKRADRYVNSGTDFEFLGTFAYQQSTGQTEVWIRGDASAGGADGYFVSLGRSGSVDLIAGAGGTYPTLGSKSFTINTSTQYKLRFRVVGTTVQFRIWAASGSEPGTWDVSVTDSAHASGYAYVQHTNTGTANTHIRWDDVLITDGVTGIDFTASETVTAASTAADLTVGMTAAETVTAAGSGAALSLGITLGATASVTAGSTAGTLDVISRVFTGALEVEFTPGVWTDITNRIAFSRGPVQVRHGRPTQYDEVGAAVLTVQLLDDDGDLMPDNPGSAYHPNWVEGVRIRWRVTKSGTTWTRFLGWVQAIEPEFPTSSTIGSTVAVTAVDALGLLAQWRMRSCWTEAALALGRSAAVAVDALEPTGTTTGWVARWTNYSLDAAASPGTYTYTGNWPNLSFTSDRDVSCGQVVTCSPDTNGDSNKTNPQVQANSLCVQWLIKTPTSIPTTGQAIASSPHPSSSATGFHIVFESNEAGAGRLVVKNVSATTTLGTLFDPAAAGQWHLITASQNAGTATLTDVTATQLGTGTAATVTGIAFDVRTLREVEFPSSIGSSQACAMGGLVAFGQRAGLSYLDAYPAGAQGTLSSRVDDVAAAASLLPVTWTKVGSLSTQVVTGNWSDRYHLDVLQELVRSGSALAWARPRDSVVHVIDVASLRPTTVLATIDTDADCDGPPRLTRAVDSRPTRVQVDAPGRSIVVVDSAAEAGPGTPHRSKTVSTVCASSTDMTALANQLLAANSGTRIKSIVIDLVTGETDHTATLFSEAGTLSGLFPTCRIRTSVPTSHFGAPTSDHYVQGWTERYHPKYVTVEADTTPALASVLASETWTGTTGAAWPAQWVAGVTGTGGTAALQAGQGRVTSGTVAFAHTARRLDITAAVDGDVVVRVTRVDATATARVVVRGDSTLATTGYVVELGASTVSLRKRVAGTLTTLTSWAATITAGTAYGVRVRFAGQWLNVRVWDTTAGGEPGTWDAAITDTAVTAAGYVGVGVVGDATTTAKAADFDDLTFTTIT